MFIEKWASMYRTQSYGDLTPEEQAAYDEKAAYAKQYYENKINDIVEKIKKDKNDNGDNSKYKNLNDEQIQTYAEQVYQTYSSVKFQLFINEHENLKNQPELTGWSQFSYIEIIQMESDGRVIPQEVLDWAHSMQDYDVTEYVADYTGNISEINENDSELAKLKKQTVILSKKSEETEDEIKGKESQLKELAEDAQEIKHSQESGIQDSLKEIKRLTNEWNTLSEKSKKGTLTKSERERLKELGILLNGKNGEMTSDLQATNAEMDDLMALMDGLSVDITEGIDIGEETVHMAKELSSKEGFFHSKTVSDLIDVAVASLKGEDHQAKGLNISETALYNGNSLITYANTLNNELSLGQYKTLYNFAEFFVNNSDEVLGEVQESMGEAWGKSSEDFEAGDETLDETKAYDTSSLEAFGEDGQSIPEKIELIKEESERVEQESIEVSQSSEDAKTALEAKTTLLDNVTLNDDYDNLNHEAEKLMSDQLGAGAALIATGTALLVPTFGASSAMIAAGITMVIESNAGLKLSEEADTQILQTDVTVKTLLEEMFGTELKLKSTEREEEAKAAMKRAFEALGINIDEEEETNETDENKKSEASEKVKNSEENAEEQQAEGEAKIEETQEGVKEGQEKEKEGDKQQKSVDNTTKEMETAGKESEDITKDTEKKQKELEKEAKTTEKEIEKEQKNIEKTAKESAEAAEEQLALGAEYESLSAQNEEMGASIQAKQQSQAANVVPQASAVQGPAKSAGLLTSGNPAQAPNTQIEIALVTSNQGRMDAISARFTQLDTKINKNRTKIIKSQVKVRAKVRKFNNIAKERVKLDKQIQKAEKAKQKAIQKKQAIIGIIKNVFSIIGTVGTILSLLADTTNGLSKGLQVAGKALIATGTALLAITFGASSSMVILGGILLGLGIFGEVCSDALSVVGKVLSIVSASGIVACTTADAAIVLAQGFNIGAIIQLGMSIAQAALTFVGISGAFDAVKAAAQPAMNIVSASLQMTSSSLNIAATGMEMANNVRVAQGKEVDKDLLLASQLVGMTSAVVGAAGSVANMGKSVKGANGIVKNGFSSLSSTQKASGLLSLFGTATSTAGQMSAAIKQSKGKQAGTLESVLSIAGSAMSTAGAITGMAGSLKESKNKRIATETAKTEASGKSMTPDQKAAMNNLTPLEQVKLSETIFKAIGSSVSIAGSITTEAERAHGKKPEAGTYLTMAGNAINFVGSSIGTVNGIVQGLKNGGSEYTKADATGSILQLMGQVATFSAQMSTSIKQANGEQTGELEAYLSLVGTGISTVGSATTAFGKMAQNAKEAKTAKEETNAAKTKVENDAKQATAKGNEGVKAADDKKAKVPQSTGNSNSEFVDYVTSISLNPSKDKKIEGAAAASTYLNPSQIIPVSEFKSDILNNTQKREEIEAVTNIEGTATPAVSQPADSKNTDNNNENGQDKENQQTAETSKTKSAQKVDPKTGMPLIDVEKYRTNPDAQIQRYLEENRAKQQAEIDKLAKQQKIMANIKTAEGALQETAKLAQVAQNIVEQINQNQKQEQIEQRHTAEIDIAGLKRARALVVRINRKNAAERRHSHYNRVVRH